MAGEAAAWFTGTGANKQLHLRLPSGAKGDKGDKGDTGTPGANGSNVLPTDTAIRDAINNEASATRGALNATYMHRPDHAAVTVTTLPKQVNSQRRYIQSAYTQDAVTTWGDWEFAVIVGADLNAWVCKRAIGSDTWVQQFNMMSIAGNPFGPQFDDSHATWTVAVDVNGRVLVTGNAHTNIAVTAYSPVGGDISSWTMIPASPNQQGVTYDKFAILENGTILRFWREGYATGGAEYFARWNPTTLAFEGETKFLDGGPSGEGPYAWRIATRGNKVSVFFCWRGEGDASTNSDMCYVESLDGGVTWKRINGAAQTMPITHANAHVIRTIPAGSGLINQGGSDIDVDGYPHVAYLLQVGTATQVIHTYWDGAAWVNDQVTDWSLLVVTAGATTLNLIHARPQIICTDLGKVYVITRTEGGLHKGQPIAIDATPGADRTPFSLAAMDLYHWEPAIDSRALRERNELKMLIVPTDPNKDSKQGFTRQWAGILTIDLAQIEMVRNRTAKIPTIRSYSNYDWGPEISVGTTAESSFVGKTVYVATAASGAADMALQVGPGVPHIPIRQSVGPGMRFFVRQSVRVSLQNGASSGNIKLRETPSAGALPQTDVAHINVASNSYTGVQDVPWCPLPSTPFVEATGEIRDTRLVPRIQSNVVDGLKIGAWNIEIGVLDYV
jgi:hypothetical protein